MLDVVIRNGRLADGRVADIGITGSTISHVGSGVGRGRISLEASNRIVAPGFVDIHTHSDFTLPLRPGATAKLMQGVTTDCTGNCGFSPFPLTNNSEGRNHGSFLEPALLDRWPSLAAYAADLEEGGLGINVAPLVGLGAVRLEVIGEADTAASDTDLREMSRLVEGALSNGAFGASSGLVYAPSAFADVGELSVLAALVAQHQGIYATHLRDEGDKLGWALDEAFEVGRRSGCAVQVSHLKALHRRNWGRVSEALARIDQENRSGQDIWADVYPYTAGSSTLASLLPAGELGAGMPALREGLADPTTRARLAVLVETQAPFGVDDVVLAAVPSRPLLNGRRLVEAAAADGLSPAELALQLIEENGVEASMIGHGMSEDDLVSALRHPRVVVASDGWTMSTDAAEYAHPRSFAYTIRLLCRYALAGIHLGVVESVQKLSLLPARRLGLVDRGFIAPGAIADVVILNPETMAERSTFARPCVHPAGVEHVLVAGVMAVESGEITGARAGRVLRHPTNRPQSSSPS